MAGKQKREKSYRQIESHMERRKSKSNRIGGTRQKRVANVDSMALAIELQLLKGTLPQVEPVPIDNYFNKWVKLYKSHLSPTTLQHYHYTSMAIKSHFGCKPLQEIKRHDYQLFLNEYGKNKSKESVEKLNSHIRACVKDAVEEQIIHLDFTRKAVLNWTTPAKKPYEKHLDFRDSELLHKEILMRLNKGLTNYLLLLGLTSGMRFGELVGLTRKDFNFENRTITVNKTWGYLKRNPRGFGLTKNEYSNRTIKIDEITMTHFKDLFDSTPSNNHQLVFYSSNSKYEVISNTTANYQLKNILNKLNIEPITVHGLRHTHASALLYKKVSIYYVSERLGHSDTETTIKEYAHLVKELREEDENKTMNLFNDINKS